MLSCDIALCRCLSLVLSIRLPEVRLCGWVLSRRGARPTMFKRRGCTPRPTPVWPTLHLFFTACKVSPSSRHVFTSGARCRVCLCLFPVKLMPCCCSLSVQAEDDVIRSGILEITDKQSVVLLSAIAMAMDLQEDAAPTDKNALAMEVRIRSMDGAFVTLAVLGAFRTYNVWLTGMPNQLMTWYLVWHSDARMMIRILVHH